MAMMVWLNKGEEHKDLYKMVTGARVANELYTRLTADNNIDAYRVKY